MTGFPTCDPDGFVPARIEGHRTLERAPTWTLQTLHAGTACTSPHYERYLRETVGSTYDWSDELRFDQTTGILRGFVLKTPEAGTIAPALVAAWLALPRRPGLPAITPDACFHVAPLALRGLSEDGRHLLALAAAVELPGADAVRLAIQEDCDLLFSRGRYCGWVLGDPVAHLAENHTEIDELMSPGDDPVLIGLVRDYLALVVYPNIDRMDDRDPELRAALMALRNRAHQVHVPGPAARALAAYVDDILDTFYG